MLIVAAIYFAGLITWYLVKAVFARREAMRRREAEAGFRRRIQRDPGNAAAYEGLADSYWSGGRRAEALAAYQEALDRGGANAGEAAIRYKMLSYR